MRCKTGGFICRRHDEVRDITASLLREICLDVAIEPQLIPQEKGEEFRYKTANSQADARLDISARDFWTRGQRAFFDIRVFDPLAPSYRNMSLQASHEKNEKDKMRKYGQRVIQIEQGSLTPLIFTTSGGMSKQTKLFL